MTKKAPILCLLLLSAGCEGGGSRNEAAPADPAASVPIAEEPETAPSVALKPGRTSVMRPSVVAEAEQADPPPPLQPVTVTIGFGAGGSALDEQARAELNALLAGPAASAPGRITIRGHSDTQGSDRQNLRASERRAEAVREYLVERGVEPERITVVALGETRPIAPNANPDGSDFEEGRRRNRRVEVEIMPASPLSPPDPAPTE